MLYKDEVKHYRSICAFFQRCNSATQRTGSRKRVVLMQKQGNCNTLHRLHVEPSSDTSALSSIITFFGGKVL